MSPGQVAGRDSAARRANAVVSSWGQDQVAAIRRCTKTLLVYLDRPVKCLTNRNGSDNLLQSGALHAATPQDRLHARGATAVADGHQAQQRTQPASARVATRCLGRLHVPAPRCAAATGRAVPSGGLGNVVARRVRGWLSAGICVVGFLEWVPCARGPGGRDGWR
ncbi:hypothetical protein P3T39_006495 [Kitasatospora sp. GP82]|nr:hypothetical protein [Kitasatospora sp. GP82]